MHAVAAVGARSRGRPRNRGCLERGSGHRKTRLAQEALNVARQSGCHVLVGRCYEQDGTPPLIPYIEILEEAARLMPAATFLRAMAPSAAEINRLLPDLRRLFPDLEPPLELPSQLRQRYLFTNIREFLARAARVHPIVIFIDDLQWADESTLQLTQYLAQHLATLPILIIVAYREADLDTLETRGTLHSLIDRIRRSRSERATPQAVKTALEDLVRQGQAQSVALKSLAETDVRGILAALGREDPPATLVRQFHDQTAGNPLFVTELFRHLHEEGRLFETEDTWKREVDLDTRDIP